MLPEKRPPKINPVWLRNAEAGLDLFIKVERDGSPNPHYVKKLEEVRQARIDFELWSEFDVWMSEKMGMRLNRYPVRIGRETHEPDSGFYKKSKEGHVTFLTKQAAWDLYRAAQQGDLATKKNVVK